MLREWRTSVERGEADDASVGQLTEIIEDKERQLAQVETKAKEVAAELGKHLEKVELPSIYEQAAGDPHLFGLYTKSFRHLSGSIHVAATLFTENRYGEAMDLDEGLGDEDRPAIRALAASVLPVIYNLTAHALGRDDLAGQAGRVHDAMLGLAPPLRIRRRWRSTTSSRRVIRPSPRGRAARPAADQRTLGLSAFPSRDASRRCSPPRTYSSSARAA